MSLIKGEVGITPQAEPTSIEFPNGEELKGSGKFKDPDMLGLIKVNERPNPYKALFDYSPHPFKEETTSFTEAVKAGWDNSVIGEIFRVATDDNENTSVWDVLQPSYKNDYEFSAEDKEYMYANLKSYDYRANSLKARNSEELKAFVQLDNENYENDLKLEKASTMGWLGGAVAGAVGDPLSYIPYVGVASKASWLYKAGAAAVQTGAINTASEGLRASMIGGEEKYVSSFLGGAIMGGGMSALGSAVGKYFGTNNLTDPATVRSNVRMNAFVTDGTDGSKMKLPMTEETPAGTPFTPHPTESGSIILDTGDIISYTNPMNPLLLKSYDKVEKSMQKAGTIKANKGFKWGSMTELSTVMYNSNSQEVINIASGLTRPLTGFKEGGIYRMTAEDVVSRESAKNNVFFEDLDKRMKALVDREQFFMSGVTDKEVSEQLNRRIVEAMEGRADRVLSTDELEYRQLMQEFAKHKENNLMNPQKFGNPNAQPLLKSSSYTSGNYFPRVYKKGRVVSFKNKLGGTEGLQDGIRLSYLRGYYTDPNVMARVDSSILADKEFLMRNGLKDEAQLNEFFEANKAALVDKYANDKAYGIAGSDQFVGSSTVDETVDIGLTGLENNNFLEARNPFDGSYEADITLSNGETIKFSANDLRDFDALNVWRAYSRRIDGDVGIMVGTGKTTKDMKNEVTALRQRAKANGDAKLTEEAKAIGDLLTILTGRSRRDPAGIADTMLSSFRDLALTAKGAYIPVLNFTEAWGTVSMGNTAGLVRNIPFLREYSKSSKVIDNDTVKEMNRALFGKEFIQAMGIDRSDLIDNLMETTGSKLGSKVAGTFKYATSSLVNAMPHVKLIPTTTNLMIDMAREGMIADLVGLATGAFKDAKWNNPRVRKAANISDEQLDGILSLIRENVTQGAEGKYSVKDMDKFTNDPRSFDLWRYGDYLAQEAIMQIHRAGSQAKVEHSGLVKSLLMFQTFAIRAMNGRTLRDYYQATRNGRYIDKALATILGAGSALSVYTLRTEITAASMLPSDRQQFKEDAYKPEVLAWVAGTRTNTLAGLGFLNTIGGWAGIDTARMAKTSGRIREREDTQRAGSNQRQLVGDLVGDVVGGTPVANVVGNYATIGTNLAGNVNARAGAVELNNQQIWKSLGEVTPPYVYYLITKIYEEASGEQVPVQRYKGVK